MPTETIDFVSCLQILRECRGLSEFLQRKTLKSPDVLLGRPLACSCCKILRNQPLFIRVRSRFLCHSGILKYARPVGPLSLQVLDLHYTTKRPPAWAPDKAVWASWVQVDGQALHWFGAPRDSVGSLDPLSIYAPSALPGHMVTFDAMLQYGVGRPYFAAEGNNADTGFDVTGNAHVTISANVSAT